MNTNKLIQTIAEIGYQNKSEPFLKDVNIFKHYFDNDKLKTSELNELDGNCTRRELLCRFLLLNAVLDQGPDVEGVRQLISETINSLYRQEIRILHSPLDFFKEIGIVLTEIDTVHSLVKKTRSKIWAEANNTNASRYNLFMDNCTQTLNYAIFRWGVPLAVPLILTNDKNDEDNCENLLDYIEDEEDENWDSSAEIMSKKIKQHKRYGLGKAIGDKAAHLYAKWIVHTFPLTRKKGIAWDKHSFEVPFDSNAGRVLFRTGYLFHWAELKDYIKYQVIQPGEGKGGTDYIRVTNIRDKKATINLDEINFDTYITLCTKHLLTHKRAPKTIHLQKIPLVQLMTEGKFGAGDLDDGLMYIGTNFCYNHDEPKCELCPINKICEGYTNRKLINLYRT